MRAVPNYIRCRYPKVGATPWLCFRCFHYVVGELVRDKRVGFAPEFAAAFVKQAENRTQHLSRLAWRRWNLGKVQRGRIAVRGTDAQHPPGIRIHPECLFLAVTRRSSLTTNSRTV